MESGGSGKKQIFGDHDIQLAARIARAVFNKRGNHSEAHLRETELAALLVIAVKAGREAEKDTGISKLWATATDKGEPEETSTAERKTLIVDKVVSGGTKVIQGPDINPGQEQGR